MNKISKYYWLILMVLLIHGCATSKVPLASNKDSTAVGITVEMLSNRSSLLKVESIDLTKLFFIKLKSKDDALTKDIILTSNFYNVPFTTGFQIDIFLFDLEPGFYAAIGGIGKGHTTKANMLVYFPEKMVRETIVEIKPNTMAYMGKFVLSGTSVYEQMNNPDEVQKYYFNNQLFDPDKRYHGKRVISNYVDPQFHSPSVFNYDKSANTEIEFLQKYKKTLKSTDWAKTVDRRLETLPK